MNRLRYHFLKYLLWGMIFTLVFAACEPMEGGFEKIVEKAGGGVTNLPPSVEIVPDSNIDGPWIRSTLRAKVTGNLAGSDTVYEWKRGSTIVQTGSSNIYIVPDINAAQSITVTVSRPSLSDEPMTSAVYSIPNVVGIYNETQLQDMTVNRNNILARGISITSGTWEPIGYITDYTGTPFTGTLDGNGKFIDFEDLNIIGHEVKFGLFYEIGSGANIKNFQLYGYLDITFDYWDNYIGLLAAYQTGGTVQNVSASVCIYGTCTEDLGGEVGACEIGGLVGRMEGGTIKNCYTIGSINQWGDSCSGPKGGIVGYMEGDSIVQNCWSGTSIYTGVGGNVGGIVGSALQPTSIVNCTAMMSELKNDLTSNDYIGAIVGGNFTWSGINPLANNYHMAEMIINITLYNDVSNKNGGKIPRTTLENNNNNFWTGTLKWLTYWGGTGEDKPWKWWNGGASGRRMPILWFENTAIGM